MADLPFDRHLGVQDTDRAIKAYAEIEIPASLRNSLALFLRLERTVLKEYDPAVCELFDRLFNNLIRANEGNPGAVAADEPTDAQGVPTADTAGARAFRQAVSLIDALPLDQAQVVVRAFGAFFHLANLSEESYRVETLREQERIVSMDAPVDSSNELVVAYSRLLDEVGPERAAELLGRLEFHPVFTAHPTEARRKAVEGKIRRIAALLDEHSRLGGSALVENERRMLQEIDALVRTSPTALEKPTPLQEADTIIDIFDNTLFEVVPQVYRRFDDWVLGERAGSVPPVCPAFFRPGSWIGSDRDGNPNVTAKVSRRVAAKYFEHMVSTLAEECRRVGRSLTLEASHTPPSEELMNLWGHQVEMSETITARVAAELSFEPHRAVMLVMAVRLEGTAARNADIRYASAEELLDDLRTVQDSLARAGAVRAAYGPVQTLIWQVETFGFHLVEMEFRQHSVVHERALADIRARGVRGALNPETREALDTFRAIGSIQKRYGQKMARRYIVSFTKRAGHVADVYELARLAFAHADDVPELDVIPLFEQLEDLEGCIGVLDGMLALPDVQRRLAQTGRRMEIMLGYSDSSKDAGPVTATLALHSAQERIARWAERNDIDLVLMHGRGGAVGRGGGPANRAVLAQPKGSVNCRFKVTEQGEVIFARYGNRALALRHVEGVAAATLLNSAPSVERVNTEAAERYADMAARLDGEAHRSYRELLHADEFAPWFSAVTPLAEVGLLPIGSRPAKRGLGARSLDDLRTIPWVFSWSQARINLAAWYGFGSACEALGDLELLRRAYREWPLFSTFVDNVEMSIAKTDARIAKMYLALGDRDDLAQTVFQKLQLTRSWVLAVVGDEWPLEHRRVLGCAIRVRNPYVDALSIAQVRALRVVRTRRDDLSEEEKAEYLALILATVTGVSAGLQNTG